MIAVLRFVGLMNAALWLGAVVFFVAGVEPACISSASAKLLGPANFPFFSGAFAHILMARWFAFQEIAAAVALLHLLAEWLYMGRPTRHFSLVLIGGLLVLVLIGSLLVEPRLENLHARHHAPNVSAAERAAAAHAFQIWHAGLQALSVILLSGLVLYVWRMANPSDAPRFISSVKFRG